MLNQLDKWLTHFALPTGADKPCIGVSACLLGRPVRYDGEDKRDPLISERLSQHVELREFCPEVGIGMSVPRPPIQVVQVGERLRIQAVEPPHTDVTDALHQYGQRIADDLDGFVLKARSPSCGVDSTPVMDTRGDQVGLDSGEFARTLQQRFPCAPLVDESALPDDAALTALLLMLHLYRHWRSAPSLTQVYDWHEQTPSLPDALALPIRQYLERLAAHSQ